jgi:Spy/CpxP family protein refolding chaperone
MPTSRLFRALASAVLAIAVAAPAASAADFTWAPPASGNWSSGANWQGGVAPSGTVGTLSFPATPCPGQPCGTRRGTT